MSFVDRKAVYERLRAGRREARKQVTESAEIALGFKADAEGLVSDTFASTRNREKALLMTSTIIAPLMSEDPHVVEMLRLSWTERMQIATTLALLGTLEEEPGGPVIGRTLRARYGPVAGTLTRPVPATELEEALSNDFRESLSAELEDDFSKSVILAIGTVQDQLVEHIDAVTSPAEQQGTRVGRSPLSTFAPTLTLVRALEMMPDAIEILKYDVVLRDAVAGAVSSERMAAFQDRSQTPLIKFLERSPAYLPQPPSSARQKSESSLDPDPGSGFRFNH